MPDDIASQLREFNARMTETLAQVGRDLEAGGFDHHLSADDLLGVVLRAHMWLERELAAMIENPLPHPERLKRWSFDHRLQLIAALGIIDETDLEACRYLDELRNRLAHRLNYEVSPQDQEAFITRLHPAYQNTVRQRASAEFPEPLRFALRLMVLMMRLRREGVVRGSPAKPGDEE